VVFQNSFHAYKGRLQVCDSKQDKRLPERTAYLRLGLVMLEVVGHPGPSTEDTRRSRTGSEADKGLTKFLADCRRGW